MRRLLFPLLLAAALAGCSRSHPNVVVVTFDTVRWDHVGWSTGRTDVTPTLDAMAARGVWFSTAIAPQPLTLPSHTSIFTGRYPTRHGVRNNGTYRVPDEEETLAELFQAEGYATHAIVSAFVLDSQFGLDQGFDGYDDDLAGGPKQKMFMFKEIRAAQTADKAVRWLREGRPRDRPFFLWLHFFDPHADYEPPDDVALEFPGDPYRGEIHYADRELGRVLEELDDQRLLDETLFAFTSDHGDSLGEHGERTHGLFVYDATTRVPLLIAGPGVPAGQRVDGVVRSLDLFPTIAELAGLEPSGPLDGASLRPLWRGKGDERTAYLETFTPRENFGWSELRGLRSATVKVIQAPQPEVYDLVADPRETRNLHGASEPEGARPLFAGLARRLEEDRYGEESAAAHEADSETRQKLAALGYVWGAKVTGDAPLADPKEKIRSWERFQVAQQLIRDKHFEPAIAAIRAILAEDAGNVVAMGSLAGALARTGDEEGALATYRKMIELDAQQDVAYLGAARLLAKRGEFDEATALVEAMMAKQPDNPDGPVAMGDLLLEREAFDEAERWFRKALELDPHSMVAASGLGNCLNRADQLPEARDVLVAARRHDPSHHATTYNLAVVTERLGDRRAALALYREAVALDPDHSMSWNNLGSLLDRNGEREEAIAAVRKAHELDPENVEATYNLGALLSNAGRPAEAIPFLLEAVQRRPDLAAAPPLLARALAATGRVDEALALWRQIAAQAPPALFQVAKLELGRGRREAARAALRQLIAVDGDRARQAIARDPELSKLLAGG